MERKKILIADDDPNILKLLEVNLQNDYEVITASDGETAYKKVIQCKPDLAILDIMMPQIDGFTLNLEMKDEEDTRSIPIIIMTGYSDLKSLFDKTKGAKVAEFIEKPIDVAILISKVKELLK